MRRRRTASALRGRKLALWVAGIKIFRLVTVYSFFLIFIVPLMADNMMEFFKEIEKSAPPGAACSKVALQH
jgi:hypothetical protein